MLRTRLLVLILVLLMGPNLSAAMPSFRKVMIVVFENTSYSRALGLPFFSTLAKQGALLKNSHGVTHPSQPNYVAMIAGDTLGVTSDTLIDLDGRTIADLLEQNGKSWKAYADAYPGACYLDYAKRPYVRKHLPFLSFKNIQSTPGRCGKIVNSDALKADIQAGTLPDYSFFVPDLNHDGHDTSAKIADQWAGETLGPLLKDRRFMDGLLLVVSFVEDDGVTTENHIYTVLVGDSVQAGSVSDTRYDHYSVLRTIEDAWKLGTLQKNDLKALPIMGVWK